MEKQGTLLDGCPVDSPDNIVNYQYDYVILLANSYKEMREQLIGIGVSEDYIIDKEHRGTFPVIRYVEKMNVIDENKDRKGKILLVPHVMNYSGAPLMLYNMAKVLRKNQYEVCVYTREWGELTNHFLQAGVHVHKFDDFEFTEEEIGAYFSEFDLIIVNTIALYDLVQKLKDISKPVIWWLHEDEDAYQVRNLKKDDIPVWPDLHVYGVGKRAIAAYQEMTGNPIEELIYGIDNREIEASDVVRKKITFAIIGLVCKRKAQDMFVEAIRKKWNAWKEQADFVIVGEISEEQRREYENTGVVRLTGSVSYDEMIKIYEGIDVVVCPSFYDPMPVVLTEGMMYKKVCIASDMTGTAGLIEPYQNGLVCKAGDVDSLAECIQWIIDHKGDMEQIGENAYQTYKSNFSMNAFEQKILTIIDKHM